MASRAMPVLRYVLLDLVGGVLRFPLWWYVEGFLALLSWERRELAFRWQSYGFTIWMKNFFVPMYGQYDWTGRIVSVFMRFVVLLGRLIGLAVEAVALVFLSLAWLCVLPVLFFLFFTNAVQGTFSL